MRQYVLSEQEKQVIKEYMETGKKLEGFNVVLHRARHLEKVNVDLELIKLFLAKVEQTKNR
jgi:predicted homoserine dehydrogenase-like protein